MLSRPVVPPAAGGRGLEGVNLDRIQVIKRWTDAAGDLHERIYDVAVSDGRQIGEDGRCSEAMKSTVSVKVASYSNSVGAHALSAYWKDPDFDPKQRAFYYVRVLEIPTPRCTNCDAKIYGVEVLNEVPDSIQERAYPSLIWYNP